MRRFINSAAFFSILLLMPLWLFATTYTISDTEGDDAKIRTLIKDKILRVRADGELEFVKAGDKLLFGGDLAAATTPDSRHSIWLMDRLANLVKREPESVIYILGNHDMNRFSLVAEVAFMEKLEHPEYLAWLKIKAGTTNKKKLIAANTRANQVIFWESKKYGLNNEGKPKILLRIQTELSAASGKPVSLEEAAEIFVKKYQPGGSGFEILKHSKVGVIEQGFVFVHAGLRAENIKKVPTVATLFERPSEWIDALNKRYDEWFKLFASGDLEAANSLDIWGDAYRDRLGMLQEVRDSPIYSQRIKENNNYRMYDKEVADFLSTENLQGSIDFHSPQGNHATTMKAYGQTYIKADTSRGARGLNSYVILEDGEVLQRTTGSDGKKIIFQITGDNNIGLLTEDGFHIKGVIDDPKHGKQYLLEKYEPTGYGLHEELRPAHLLKNLKLPVAAVDEVAMFKQARNKAIIKENFPKIHMHEGAEDFRRSLGGRKVIFLTGSSRLPLDGKKADEVKSYFEAIAKLHDPKEYVILTGATELGPQATDTIAHKVFLKYGFNIFGTVSKDISPAEINPQVSGILWRHSGWNKPILEGVDIARDTGGKIFVAGGGSVPGEAIKYAHSIGMNSADIILAQGFGKDSASVKFADLGTAIYSPNEIPEVFGPLYSSEDYYGRMLRGRTVQDFKSMTDDPSRRLVLFMDNEGLENIRAMQGDEALATLGYTHEYTEGLKQSGYEFKLAAFQAKPGEVVPATWDNIYAMVARAYPSAVAEKLKAQLPNLKSMHFSQVELLGGASFSQIYKAGSGAPDYINAEKLAKGSGSLWEVRAFLYNELRLSELFRGDGFTYRPDGTRGLAEYIGLNFELDPYKEIKLLPVHVSPPNSNYCSEEFATMIKMSALK